MISISLSRLLLEMKMIIEYPEFSKTEFIFENESIGNIIEKLSDSFGIEIIIVNEEINKCVFTGDISDMGLLTQIEIIFCKRIKSTCFRLIV